MTETIERYDGYTVRTVTEPGQWVRVEVTYDSPPPPTRDEALHAAARVAVEAHVKAGGLDDATLATLAPLYDPWRPGEGVRVGDLRSWDAAVVECIQAHTTQADWTPGATPALWKVHRTTAGAAPDAWVQPTGAHDAYQTGARVTFNGAVYESLINANVWSPTAYPAGWLLIP